MLRRNEDGVLVCRRGHTQEDEVTGAMRQGKIKRKAEKRKQALIYPDCEEQDIILFRVKNPFEQPSGFRKEAGENTPTFEVYDELTRMEEEYGRVNFRRIKGSVWKKGDITCKYGFVICDRRLSEVVKSRLENIILSDGTNYTLEDTKCSCEEIKKVIKQDIIAMRKRGEILTEDLYATSS